MKILNISYALPSKCVDNDEMIETIIDQNRGHLSDEEQISLESRIRRFFQMSGTQTRFHRNVGEKALDFALKAGREALKKAGVKPEDVDLLIYAGVGRGWVEPATANLFQCELGLKSATCFDVLDACASWIRSLWIARTFLAQKIYKLVMIINCEFNFREYANFEIENNEQLDNAFSAFTIGEAATATLVAAGEQEEDDSHFSFRTWGKNTAFARSLFPTQTTFLQMVGQSGSNLCPSLRFPPNFFPSQLGNLWPTLRKPTLWRAKYTIS